MNKLELKIYEAMKAEMPDFMFAYYDMDVAAKVSASIALELAEKSFHRGWSTGYAVATIDKDEIVNWDQFKQEVL